MAQRRALTRYRDLLDMSLITTGKLARKTEVFEPHDIIRNAIHTARRHHGLGTGRRSAPVARIRLFGTHFVKPIEPQQIIDVVDDDAAAHAAV